jgi:peptidyl-tRNA hydrolase
MTFETFSDPCYFDMWCVRKTGDKDFDMTVHVMSKLQAEHAKRVIEEWVKQGQREILLKAANKLNYGDIAYTELRKMADEL